MSQQFTIIEAGIGQWRSAGIDEDGLPTSLNFHDDIAISPLDAIFDGRITKVDTTLDMAFLDLGNGLTGVLNFRRARLLVKGQVGSITDCVKEGDLLRVQVVSEPSALEDKALPVTPRPRITGRYTVAETGGARLNFSKDISQKATARLKKELAPLVSDAAVIVRARAGLVHETVVATEIKLLLEALGKPQNGTGLIYAWSPAEKALLGIKTDETDIFAESGTTLSSLKNIAKNLWPDMVDRLQLFKGESKSAAFEELGVEEAIEEALSARINLPSGGWINITPTPALTAVDVNLGGALKHMAAGEAILVTNMEATLALAYHLDFQDIGGIIIADFINMSAKGSTRELMQHIERTFRESRVPIQHTGISQFGLVEFTRKRSGLSLRDRLEKQRGPIERPAAMGLVLLRKAARIGNSADVGTLVVQAPKATLNWIETNDGLLDQLRSKSQRTILLEQASKADTFIKADGS